MSVEIKPIGDKCNISCAYCYEKELRRTKIPTLDLKAIEQAILKFNVPFTIFGGEPLLLSLDMLEHFFKLGFEKFGRNCIQTNALAITPAHIELFKKYKVHIGISMDGPGELNEARCNLELTGKIESNIADLILAGVIPSFIVTISRANTGERLRHLLGWFEYLDGCKVAASRLHNVEDNGHCSDFILTDYEQFEAFVRIYEFSKTLKNLKFDVFEDIKAVMRGKTNHITCIWNGCDPYSTASVDGIRANGEVENCGRVYKDGRIWLKSTNRDSVRQDILRTTPQEFGGCSNCRFFRVCKGQCPGTAIDGDWRNRTRDCEFWKLLLNYFEKEVGMVECEEPKQVNGHADVPHGDYHGDHTNVTRIQVPVVK